MKKIFSAIVLIGFLAVLVAPQLALAQETVPNQCTMKRDVGVTGCPVSGPCPFSNTQCGICCLLNTLYNIVDWVFVLLVAVSVIWIILGAYTLITAAGDEKAVPRGRDYVMYAAIGLVVALMARAVPAVVKMVVAGA